MYCICYTKKYLNLRSFWFGNASSKHKISCFRNFCSEWFPECGVNTPPPRGAQLRISCFRNSCSDRFSVFAVTRGRPTGNLVFSKFLLRLISRIWGGAPNWESRLCHDLTWISRPDWLDFWILKLHVFALRFLLTFGPRTCASADLCVETPWLC